MSSTRAHRSASISLALCMLAVASCRTASEPASNPDPADTVVSLTPPFQTKEPQRYSATRTITVFKPNGEQFSTRTVIGRDDLRRRDETASEQTRIVYLESPEGRFILWPEQNVYAVIENESATDMHDFEVEENSPDRLLHTDPSGTTYQSLGTDIVDGRSAAKYRIVVNSLAAENVTPSETLIWIDNALNMPIKSELRSRDGVVIVTELSDITLPPDKQLFQIPAGYEKIAFSVLQKQLRARGLNP